MDSTPPGGLLGIFTFVRARIEAIYTAMSHQKMRCRCIYIKNKKKRNTVRVAPEVNEDEDEAIEVPPPTPPKKSRRDSLAYP
jgi:hypothetical protein